MEIKTTFYDIVGYLVPGIVLLAVLFVGYNNSMQCQQPFLELKDLILNMSYKEAIVLGVLSYLIGHFISSISYPVIEWLLLKIPCFKRFYRSEKIVGSNMYKAFSEKFKKTFGYEPQAGDFATCICYVESKQPAVYSTTLIFKSFYGMARNLTLILWCYSLWELINWKMLKNHQSIGYFVVSLVVSFIIFYHYLRFLRYFKQNVLNGFILPLN
ncbi:MAG: hypothetical protein JW749_11510 [Sedimentisphaerales bacterium]|nr:hypothetical protein [Sedimentisphaerales bacterium]